MIAIRRNQGLGEDATTYFAREYFTSQPSQAVERGWRYTNTMVCDSTIRFWCVACRPLSSGRVGEEYEMVPVSNPPHSPIMPPFKEKSKIPWAHIHRDLAQGTICTVSDLEEALIALEKSPIPSVLFDSLEAIWNKPDSAEILDYLLGWGTASFRFGVIRQAIMDFEYRRDQSRIEGHEDNNQTFELTPELLAERILQKDPKVLSEFGAANNGEGSNLLHYAIEFGTENVINVILKLYKDNKIENPEKLLVEAGNRRDSPFMKLIKKNECLGPVQTILQALPALKIDDSVLSMAIELEKNDVLLAFTSLRPDCVTIELLSHCISSDQEDILNEVLKTRTDLLYGNGLLQSAMRKGNTVIIETLLKAWPDLAIEYDGEISPLYCLQQEDVKAKLDQTSRQHIRSVIVPYIVRRAEAQLSTDGDGRISATEQIRRLLADPEGM